MICCRRLRKLVVVVVAVAVAPHPPVISCCGVRLEARVDGHNRRDLNHNDHHHHHKGVRCWTNLTLIDCVYLTSCGETPCSSFLPPRHQRLDLLLRHHHQCIIIVNNNNNNNKRSVHCAKHWLRHPHNVSRHLRAVQWPRAVCVMYRLTCDRNKWCCLACTRCVKSAGSECRRGLSKIANMCVFKAFLPPKKLVVASEARVDENNNIASHVITML